jgi:hypothetical protein
VYTIRICSAEATLTAVHIHLELFLHRVTIVRARWAARVDRNHSQEQRAAPLDPAVQHRGHDRQGRARLGGTAALGLRAGNEVRWAVARVRWWSERVQGPSEGWVRPGDPSVDPGHAEGY